ncbi:flagellar assembly protein FliW [Vallitalea pronyensis]|uniref:Flagellar assembly factor FliW n=1 Tax=Vallitalea pronyensis TaxID=1348613 RepID=A0A8J8MH18_9FIRM|nr:flagellar assembly protein FliW [Vallitalea pronyensis]QUI21454.1 flagellar assembly protein FliW [Vallitalea pronyensis]
MLMNTKHFGTIDMDDEHIITFEEGIFGFNDDHRFIILYENDLLCWLQSIDDVDIVLPMITTPLIFPEYQPEVKDELILRIGDLSDEDLMVHTIVVIPSDIEQMTTNLKAPIIINNKTKKGMQVILEDDQYQVKHNLYQHLKQYEQKVGE